MAKENTPLLDVRNLQVQFKTQDGIINAVNNVSFTVNRGETLGIVGESGSGKSVTSLAIMRLIPSPPGKIAGGQILFDGEDLVDYSEAEMRKIRGNRISMIFQDPMTSLNPVLRIGRQMTESLQLHMNMNSKQARDRAVELLSMVGIPSPRDRLDDYPHQFSGGMRQRVMIAMGLSCNPELLIADEPTTALDVTIQAQILELLNRLKDETGTAIIFITHDLGVVAGMTDRVMVMYAGRAVEQTSTQQLYDNPRMPYTMGLLDSIPRLDEGKGERLTPIRGLPPDMLEKSERCPFAPRCDFVQDVCWTQVPPLRSVAPNHQAACLFDIQYEQRQSAATKKAAEEAAALESALAAVIAEEHSA